MTDVLKTVISCVSELMKGLLSCIHTLQVRSFFGDPASKDPLEKQIQKKFKEFDADGNGSLDKKEMRDLLRMTAAQCTHTRTHSLPSQCTHTRTPCRPLHPPAPPALAPLN